MAKARVLVDDVLVFLEGRFFAELKVFDVPVSRKFPDGIKVRCVLVDAESKKPVLLLDNHEPFGFHLHTKLPEDKNFRVSLMIETYPEAIAHFMKEAKKVVKREK
ncbi:MAG: hypothetical protein IPK04_10260 [Bdellovibrionales bacterium]|nr:hypothetical protein [Bdellovibrionales bacterium]